MRIPLIPESIEFPHASSIRNSTRAAKRAEDGDSAQDEEMRAVDTYSESSSQSKSPPARLCLTPPFRDQASYVLRSSRRYEGGTFEDDLIHFNFMSSSADGRCGAKIIMKHSKCRPEPCRALTNLPRRATLSSLIPQSPSYLCSRYPQAVGVADFSESKQ